jgi:hypothetical protein
MPAIVVLGVMKLSSFGVELGGLGCGTARKLLPGACMVECRSVRPAVDDKPC